MTINVTKYGKIIYFKENLLAVVIGNMLSTFSAIDLLCGVYGVVLGACELLPGSEIWLTRGNTLKVLEHCDPTEGEDDSTKERSEKSSPDLVPELY